MFARDIQQTERLNKARRNLERAVVDYRDAQTLVSDTGQFNAVDETASSQTTRLSARPARAVQHTLTDC